MISTLKHIFGICLLNVWAQFLPSYFWCYVAVLSLPIFDVLQPYFCLFSMHLLFTPKCHLTILSDFKAASKLTTSEILFFFHFYFCFSHSQLILFFLDLSIDQLQLFVRPLTSAIAFKQSVTLFRGFKLPLMPSIHQHKLSAFWPLALPPYKIPSLIKTCKISVFKVSRNF